jgi:hypothetical protein
LDLLTAYSHTQLETAAILHTIEFTVAHALGFSVCISRILATDLSPSHSNFTSYMKSSFHSLITFLPLYCNCQFRRFDYSRLSFSALQASQSQSQSYSQSVRLGDKPLRLTTRDFLFQLYFCGNSPYVTSYLTRSWVCLL